ncbi:MAG: dihydropteroate synthase, partial [Deltaproteobacteria bacterium]
RESMEKLSVISTPQEFKTWHLKSEVTSFTTISSKIQNFVTLLKICAESMIQLFKFNHKTTGTGALDVTPMCDPKLSILPNCTAEQISLETYEDFILKYDNQVTDACAPAGIHHCGSVNEILDGYAKVRHLEFIEIGFGSDVKRTRKVFGPDVAVNARISPVLMKNGTVEDVSTEVRRLIDNGSPLKNFSIDTVGLTYGTPDENVKAALRTAEEYGKLSRDTATVSEKGIFPGASIAKTPVETIVKSASKEVVIGGTYPLIIIGERLNPTGRKKLAQALEDGKFEMVQSEALKQVAEGAQILDVNVGVSGIDEPKVLVEAIKAIGEVTDVPLCLDSALPEALAAGLKEYNGKALVNSVNGENQKLDQILPLVKAHDAVVIGLTMDDNGIPKEAEKRLEIARLIVERAQQEGIPREDIIIDPLAMAVSADDQAALETIKALRLIRDELGVNQTLGLSNISFGLPGRASINAIFLAMAALSGMTCPIADPTDWDLRQSALIFDMLAGKDEYCSHYISTYGSKMGTAEAPKIVGKGKKEEDADLEALKEAVIQGKRKIATEITQKFLDEGADPQTLIDGYLIPALNVVGEKFEQKKIFVPEMMIAAKSMQACVDLIKPFMKKEEQTILGTVVLGTVFGDLHHIGKNLAKLLLETSGFKIIDLGENVPAEKFVTAAEENNADLVGLSSLLTTGDPHVKETIEAIKASSIGDKVKIICGGAALSQKFVEACGGDAYAKDAAEGIKKSKTLLGIS